MAKMKMDAASRVLASAGNRRKAKTADVKKVVRRGGARGR
jgi:hypothetical protein